MFLLRATSLFSVLVTALRVEFSIVLATVSLSGGVVAQSADSGEGIRPARPPLVMRVPEPPTPVVVEGSKQLVYELHLTSSAPRPLTLQRVEVLDAKSRTLLARIGGDLLESRLHLADNSSRGKKPLVVSPGERAVIYLEVTLDGDAMLLELEHRVTFRPLGQAAQHLAGARIPVQRESPPVLAAPLRGGPWVAVHNPAWERVHSGQVIALLGFTGQTTGPHLHFHVADVKSPLGAEGTPFVFEDFSVLGTYADIGKLGKAPWESIADAEGGRYVEEKPASNTVLVFDSNN